MARLFMRMLDRVLRMRYAVIGGTVALFVAALVGMQFVQQQFFPSSDRPELLVDLTLPQGSSLNATRKTVDDLEKILKTDPDIEHWSFYVGSGAIRFYLPLDQQLANDFFAQAVVVTKGFKVRPAVQQRILAALRGREFEQVLARVSPLELGPPVGWPLKFRISGPDPMKVRELAQSFASVLGNSPNAHNINFDWNEPSKVVRVEVDQDRARALGISSQALSQTINAVLSGTTVTQVRDDIYLDRRGRPRGERGARQARDLAQPAHRHARRPRRAARADGEAFLRARAAAGLAPPASADRDGAGRHGARRRGRDRREGTRRRSLRHSRRSCRPAMTRWSAARSRTAPRLRPACLRCSR